MKISELYKFVNETDVASNQDSDKRERIATLGLVSEIGSVLSALKKDILSDDPDNNGIRRYLIRGELKEEIGDAIWYAVMLAQCLDDPGADDIFSADIRMLERQLSGKSRNDRRVQKGLGEERQKRFLDASVIYLRRRKPTVDQYQKTAYKTRRTDDNVLRNVCAAVLQQLASQLSREFLPDVEMGLNHEVRPKDPVNALGEIAWHLAALASIYDLRLSEVLKLTQEKADFRNPQGTLGPKHNERTEEGFRFPDRFEVHFVDPDQGKARMYWVKDGIIIMRLGDPLTDNNYKGDGYRFHDVMHLAFAAYLGWSPNLRAFMGKKRKYDKDKDNVEDGGRAKILEEAVILEIHQHAKRLQDYIEEAGLSADGSPYEHENALSFEFLRRLHDFTEGHEVYQNPKQDWERAIRSGYDCYYSLTNANGGIIEVDMRRPKLKFREFTTINRLDYDHFESEKNQEKSEVQSS